MLELAAPKTIADYAILKSLGSGSTGSVKLARHIPTGQLVALKIIKDSLLMSNSSLYSKSRREIAVLKLLSSLTQGLPSPDGLPVASRLGVMQLLDVLQVPDATILVLEYCSGGELFDALVERGCLPLDVVLDYLQQLAFALRFCHTRGVCHRDLKPENVLLTDDARVKLVDFGMAIMHTPGTLLQTSCGSPQYCAPEVLLNEPYDGRTADVWSLGVTLYAMTTGGLPFDEDNVQRLIAKIRDAAFYIPPEVPVALADLLRAMLTADPNQRITLDEVIASPWFNSQPPRPDVYFEAPSHQLPSVYTPDMPVYEPEAHVVRHLVSLGLGDGMTIKLRLRAEKPCRERDFYYALAAFRPAVEASSSPAPTTVRSNVQTTPNGYGVAADIPTPQQLKAMAPVLNATSATSQAQATAAAMLLQGGAAAAAAGAGMQPKFAYNDPVSAVVGQPPPSQATLELAAGALPVSVSGSVPIAGSHLLESVRSLLPAWIGALPHEQPAPLATSVGSDGPLSAQIPLS